MVLQKSSEDRAIDIDQIIDVLERYPDVVEVQDALLALRHERVKEALAKTVDAAKFDLAKMFEDFLQDGVKRPHTRETYKREVGRIFAWLELRGVHPLQVTRADVNYFKDYLRKRGSVKRGPLSENSVRLILASCSSFWRYLEDEGYISRSPFLHIKYPRKRYRKDAEGEHPEPVMTQDEYLRIMEELRRRADSGPGKSIAERRVRDSAWRLLPLVHFLGMYGLRVGDVLTVKIGNNSFSWTEKGGITRTQKLERETSDILGAYIGRAKSPFDSIAKSTVQGAIRRLTTYLFAEGAIRHSYSAHDFRHMYAMQLYQKTRDIYLVSRKLGHSNTAVTEIYLRGIGLDTRVDIIEEKKHETR